MRYFLILTIVLAYLFAKRPANHIQRIECSRFGVLTTIHVYYRCEITITNYGLNKIEKVKTFLDYILKNVFNLSSTKELFSNEMATRFVRDDIQLKQLKIYLEIIFLEIHQLKFHNKTKQIITHTNKSN